MSQERVSKKSRVLKERLEEKAFSLSHGRKIILNLSYQLIDKGPAALPALHLFASATNAYTTTPGIENPPGFLNHKELGSYQFQLLVQVANRVKFLTAAELEQFEKGGYIGIGVEVDRRSILVNPDETS